MAIKAGETQHFLSRTVSILTVWGIQSQKFLPVKLGVLSINVMKFLVYREYEWMPFFTLLLILIRNYIWSIY